MIERLDEAARAPSAAWPSVTVAVPVLDEEEHIEACLHAIAAQDYPGDVEIVVVDGGSSDATVRLAAAVAGVRVVPNPDRIQAAGLNRALAVAEGAVFVRVDARTRLAPDHLTACVRALQRTGAALVGGAQVPTGRSVVSRAVAFAMASRVAVGAARFHRPSASGRWVDTVYLGATWTSTLRSLGGYPLVPVNEDAALAHCCRRAGGVWMDPAIRSEYVVRTSVRSIVGQYVRYGRGRATTIVTGATAVRGRHAIALAAPILVLTRGRRVVLVGYGATVAGAAVALARKDPAAALALVVVVPLMQVAWLVGAWSVVLRRGPRLMARRLAGRGPGSPTADRR